MNAIEIGEDGLCKCHAGSECPFGKTGAERRCSKDVLEVHGIPTFKAGQWVLWELEPCPFTGERRWSAGKNGPRVYLTCDEETAKLILNAVNRTL